MTGEAATRVRDLIRDICGHHEVKTIKRHVPKTYFWCSSENVTDGVIAKFGAEQNVDRDEDFRE